VRVWVRIAIASITSTSITCSTTTSRADSAGARSPGNSGWPGESTGNEMGAVTISTPALSTLSGAPEPSVAGGRRHLGAGTEIGEEAVEDEIAVGVLVAAVSPGARSLSMLQRERSAGTLVQVHVLSVGIVLDSPGFAARGFRFRNDATS
jgi:hypothetical protein